MDLKDKKKAKITSKTNSSYLQEKDMNKEESKVIIMKEWENRAENPDSDNYEQMDSFFRSLKKEQPKLFTWKITNADNDLQADDLRWQEVRGWLNIRTRNY